MKKSYLFIILLSIITIILIILSINRNYHLVKAKDDLIVYTTNGDYTGSNSNCCKYGLMNRDGEIYYKTKYNYIEFFNHIVVLKNYNTIEFIHEDNPKEILLKVSDVDLSIFTDELVIQTKEGDYLINTKTGRVVQVDRDYSFYLSKIQGGNLFNEDRAVVKTKDGHYGFIEPNGKTVIEPKYKNVSHFDELGYVVFEDNSRYGLLDKNGKIHLPATYDELTYDAGYYKAVKIDKQGIIDHEGNEMIPITYDWVSVYQGIFIAKKNNKYGTITINNAIVADFIYDEISFFKGGYASFKLNEKYGVISLAGEMIVQPIYDYIYDYSFKDGFAYVKLNNKFGLIDLEGHTVIDIQYDTISLDSESIEDNIIIAQKDRKWGLIDLNENIIVDFLYYTSIHRTDKWIIFVSDNKLAIYDHTGNQLTDFIYEDVIGNKVEKAGKWGLINDLGEEIINVKYDVIRHIKDDYYIALLEGKYGVFHLNEAIIDFEYDFIIENKDGFLLEKNGHIYEANWEGELNKIR